MECVVIIVNGVKRLTIITKHSILDVVAALDSPVCMIYRNMDKFIPSTKGSIIKGTFTNNYKNTFNER